MAMLEDIKILENGKGIQHLLNSATIILNNPLFMIDSNYNMIAITDVPVDEPRWNELATIGTFRPDTMEFLANEGFIEEITNADKIVILKGEKLKYSKLTGHVFNRDNIRVGLLMMSECNTIFTPQIIAAFEALVDKITNEIRDYDYFTMFAMTFHEDKINLLLDGTVKNPLLFNPQAQILYDDFEDYLYVAVVILDRKNIIENVHLNRLEYFKSMLKTKYHSFKYSVYSNYIVMLMSSKHKNFYSGQFFSIYADLFKQNGLSIGLSDSFENIYDLRFYYDQAVTALTKGLKNKEDQFFFQHNESL